MKTYLLIILFGFFVASLGNAEIKKHSEKVKGPQTIKGVDAMGMGDVWAWDENHKVCSLPDLKERIEEYKKAIPSLQKKIADYLVTKKNRDPYSQWDSKDGYRELKMMQAKLNSAMYWFEKRTKEEKGKAKR